LPHISLSVVLAVSASVVVVVVVVSPVELVAVVSSVVEVDVLVLVDVEVDVLVEVEVDDVLVDVLVGSVVVGVPVVGVPVVVVASVVAGVGPLSDSRWQASTVTRSATQPSLLASHRLQNGRSGSRAAQLASPDWLPQWLVLGTEQPAARRASAAYVLQDMY